MSQYLSGKQSSALPRLPLEGILDLTYRCNNACRHCWLWRPATAPEKEFELSCREIRCIADEARAMGCQRWHISGGEPMLRSDFREIFDYLTRKARSYSLNSNGTLITPALAQLLKRKGTKMIALYGATAGVYERVTRNPGGFEQAMRGFAYLREAGAGFVVQLIPMRENYHQWDEMLALARALSPHYRVGAPWLFLTADRSSRRNAEIAAQRLEPHEVLAVDPPSPIDNACGDDSCSNGDAAAQCGMVLPSDDRLFAACISARRDFHIDPYGGMTFCSFIKDPALRYNLRRGSFRAAWEEFIPSLADRVRGGTEYLENCGACEKRRECRWCAVYGYLEKGRFSAPVPYLCGVAHAAREYKIQWKKNHRVFYRIAGVTVQVDADLPITDETFDPKFESFKVDGPGEDTITIHHHFELPDLAGQDLGQEVYRKAPWAISRKGISWLYLGISPDPNDRTFHKVAVVREDHTHADIYSPNPRDFTKGGLSFLTLSPTDQILLGRVLADRQGCFLHSSGVVMDGQGLLFVGHSEAGKSTTVKMLKDRAEILCDDRIIVRRWPEGFKIHGTWSHGEVPEVSSASAPLKAILFLKKSAENRITPIEDRRVAVRTLLACLIKPLVTADWWEKMLTLIEAIAREVPCHQMEFDTSGEVFGLLEALARDGAPK